MFLIEYVSLDMRHGICIIEYINYETDPDLSLSRLGKMTTAIPFFFKPVEYNGNFYVDGGLRGHYPIEQCKTENYLGIFIQGGSVPQESELYEWIPILKFIHSLMINQDDIVHQIKSNNYSKKDTSQNANVSNGHI